MRTLFQRFAIAAQVLPFLILFMPALSCAQGPITYRVRYDVATPQVVRVTLEFASSSDTKTGIAAPFTLIMPRAVPGGYAQRPYDPFVINMLAHGANGLAVDAQRDESAPRWIIGRSGERVVSIDYDVDVKRMEREVVSAADSSKVRNAYVGLLGYSIFAFIEKHESDPVRLEISSGPAWPIFSTLAPKIPAPISTLTAQAADYYGLADSQIMMGSKLRLREVPGENGGVPLFLAAYVEGDDDLQLEGSLAREALDRVVAYFGKAPFAHYTVALEVLKPLSDRHEYNFSMEHLDSGTFYFDTNRALVTRASDAQREIRRFNYAHHMAHSWIPKRAYGENYLPFRWEMAPIIETIWFNEGFARYAAIEAFAEAMPREKAAHYRRERLDRLQGIVDSAPPFLRAMSLPELSREGSFLYSADFRTGMNLFSRGALMAAEMDDAIQAQTSGEKSLRDALRHLLEWSAENQRAFRVEELPQIFHEATGVDTTAILNRRLQPVQ
jgi:predicted metalloprotease with PDZ domain